MKKGLVILLAVVMVLTFGLSACSKQETPAPTPTPAVEKIGGKLVVWTWDGHLTKDVENFKAAYPDVELDVQVLPDFFTKIKQVLVTGIGQPDVIMVESGQYGEFAQNPAFEVLNQEPYNADELKSQFLEFWWNNGLSLNGELRVFPRSPGMGAAFYRRDVAIKAFGTDDPAELEALLPTLEAVVEKAAAFKAAVGENSTLVTGADAIFLNKLAQQGKSLYDKDANNFDANRLREPAELALAGIAAGLKPTSAAFWDDMKAGNYLYFTGGSWNEAYTIKAGLGNDENGVPVQNGLWGVMSAPGGNVNQGGNGFAILASSKNKTAAWAFVKSITTDVDVAVNYLKEVAVYPALIAAQNTDYFKEANEFMGGQQTSLKYGELAAKTVQIPVTPYDAAINGIISKHLGSLLDKSKTVDEFIATVAAEVKSEVGIATLPEPAQ